MKKLYLIGAGDFGREVLEWASAMPVCGKEWIPAGFLDSRKDALKGYALPEGIAGDPSTWTVEEDHVFACPIGNPVHKMKYAGMIREKGGRFINIIHPTAIIGSRTRIGEGCILCPNSVLSVDVSLGDLVTINCFSGVGHDAVIGEGTTLSSHCDVTGHVRLGKGVFMGSHASILPHAVVGDYAIIGAGSVVLKKVSSRATAFGLPAREVIKPEERP